MASEGKTPGEDSGTAQATDPPADAYPRLRHIEITNYKAIDHLVLDIPAPTMPGDPDIFVVGSKNGLGKTSLLECCALAQLMRFDNRRARSFLRYLQVSNGPLLESFWHPPAKIGIDALHGDGKATSLTELESLVFQRPVGALSSTSLPADSSNFAKQFFGHSPNPLRHPALLFFHSYRKVPEGTISTRDMLAPGQTSEDDDSPLKRRAIRLLLASSGLVEGAEPGAADQHLHALNGLLSTFAGGRIDKKLRPVAQDQLDLRIVTPRGTTFSFDALSSGQKEIVTTLFLIWNETLAHPALVLIDEPELHLNAEWQREFLRHLLALAPNNQYILATHSEDIFASVADDRRVLLEASHG